MARETLPKSSGSLRGGGDFQSEMLWLGLNLAFTNEITMRIHHADAGAPIVRSFFCSCC